MKRVALLVLVPYVVLAYALFLPALWWPNAALYTRVLSARWLEFIGSVGMFAPLATGAVFAVGVARRLDPENRARPAWRLLSAWLVCFTLGQGILGVYNYVLHAVVPIPSAGDAFFVAGYALLAVGAAWFVRVYTTSGMPIGPVRRLVVLGVLATLALGVLSVVLLFPLFHAPRPWPEVAITAGYPLFDFVVMVPMVILVRITLRFQGGRVWTVWASILAGFTLLAVADTLFAYLDLMGAKWLDPLLDPLFMTANALTAYGAALQFDMVGPRPASEAKGGSPEDSPRRGS